MDHHTRRRVDFCADDLIALFRELLAMPSVHQAYLSTDERKTVKAANDILEYVKTGKAYK